MSIEFFNGVDIRKLHDIADRVVSLEEHYVTNLEDLIERNLDPEPRVQTHRDQAKGFIGYDGDQRDRKSELDLLMDLDIAPAIAVVVRNRLMETLLRSPEHRELVNRLAVMIRLEHGDEIAKIQHAMDGRIAQQEKDLIKIRNRNKTKRAELANTFKGQSRVLDEAKDLSVVRRNKMIRSMNKALETVGTPDKLSSYDAEVFRIMQMFDLVGFDGSIWCCKETNVLMLNPNEFARFAYQLKLHANRERR